MLLVGFLSMKCVARGRFCISVPLLIDDNLVMFVYVSVLCRYFHVFCRILFPYMSGGDEHISSMGHTRLDGFSDSEDYVSIESGEIMDCVDDSIFLLNQSVCYKATVSCKRVSGHS